MRVRAIALLLTFVAYPSVVQAQGVSWVGGGNEHYLVTMDDLTWHRQAGMFAILTASDHPLTRQWGRAVEVISTRRDCVTCPGGAQDLAFTVVRSHASRRAYVLGRNRNFLLTPESGWSCVDASEVAPPLVEPIDEPGPGRGVRGTWFLDDGVTDLVVELRLAVHGEDWIGSHVEMTLSVTNAGSTETAASARALWANEFTGRMGSSTWDPSIGAAYVGERPSDPPVEPFAEVETEWVNPEFRMWEAHGASAEPSRWSFYYSVAGLVKAVPGIAPAPTPPEFFQVAEMNYHGNLAPVAGGGAVDACFEWHVGPTPRRIRDLQASCLTTAWGMSDETAVPLPPGATASFTQYLVAFKRYPLAADAGGPYVATCTGDRTSVPLEGRAVLSDPTSAVVYHEWSSSSVDVVFDDSTSATPVVTVPRAGTYPIQLTVTAGVYQASAETTLDVQDSDPPRFVQLAVTPESLWPPNHRLVPVRVTAVVEDDCDAAPTVRLVSVSSNEPDDGRGDGRTSGDIVGAAVGTDDRELQLRAERTGSWRGREYALVYEAEDASGNVTSRSVTVRVPHDLRLPRMRPRR